MAYHCWRRLCGWGALLLVAACTGTTAQVPPTAAPTLTLIPATATFTPLPPQPTATTPPRVAPGDVLRPTPAMTEEADADTDPVAAEMIALAVRRVANEADVDASAVDVVNVEPVLWQDRGLGCPLPDTVYAPTLVAGYRIVLEADDTDYFVHTSFTELILCDPENVVLPAPTDADTDD